MSAPTSRMINHALESAAAKLVEAFGGTWSPSGAMCRRPAHDDRSLSLSVRIGERSLLFKCFAGCGTRDLLRAIRRPRLDMPVTDARPGQTRS